MPSVEIAAVGTELLLGDLVDTNTPHVAQALAGSGIDVFGTHAVGDNRERIAALFRRCLERSDGLIATGGLGPTIDDLTKEAVCDVLRCDTELHEPSLRAMERAFASLGREMRANNRKQAEIPRGAFVLENPHGTAPGFVAFAPQEKFIACMPGVPREMRPMLADGLLQWLRERFDLRNAITTRILHTINIAESEIDHRISDMFSSLENPKIAVLAHEYRCDVKLMVKAENGEEALRLLAPVEHEVLRRLDGHVFGVDDQTLPAAIHGLLERSHRTVAVAESFTAGSVASALGSTPGASKTFLGAVVAYDNELKVAELGVDRTVLERDGAVSESVARMMAEGAVHRLGAAVGISTTGIAGPTGATPEKPVGLAWVGLADRSGSKAVRLQLRGSRAAIQSWGTVASLGLLWKTLEQEEPIRVDGS